MAGKAKKKASGAVKHPVVEGEELVDELLVADDVDIDVDIDVDADIDTEEDEEPGDLEEELHPDDMEEPLDILLLERTGTVLLDETVDDEEEEEDLDDDPSDGISKVPPKRPDEFLCMSCFLVKHPSQFADKERSLCRDCV